MRTKIFLSETPGKLDQNFYKIRFIGLIAFVVLNLFAYAHSEELEELFTISGTLTTEDEAEGLPFAQVVLLQSGELITGTASDIDGNFVLKAKPGKYELKITAVGFEEHKREMHVEKDHFLGNIQLKASETELDEIVIEVEREKLIKESFGGLDSREPPVVRGGRSSLVVTYIDGMPVKSTSKKSAEVVMEMADYAYMDEAPAEATETEGPGGESYTGGTLTAGELNDFNKFNAWSDLVKGDLSSYAAQWKIAANHRFSVMLTNEENGAVIDADIKLIDQDERVLWKTKTNNVGRAELWTDFVAYKVVPNQLSIRVTYNGGSYETQKLVPSNEGVNYLKLPVQCFQPDMVDVAFVVDATGSMGDEISYLKAELYNVIHEVASQNKELTFNTAGLFYKDISDDYVTVSSDFTDNLDITISFIQDQQHGGGGDMPEAVDSALSEAVNGLAWSQEARSRILFLVLDAPPHTDDASVKRMERAITTAAKKGIRIVPIICSGANKSNEYLMRTASLATNGTYLFLTDHSGIGGSHLSPSTDEYEVTYLNDLMKDVINRFIEGTSCQNEPYFVDRDAPRLVDHVVGNTTIRRHEPTENKITLELVNKVISTSGDINGVADNAKDHFDKDGENNEIQTAISVFPNPTLNVLNVHLTAPQERVMLLDISGKLLREYNTGKKEQFSISLKEYPGGLYLIGFMKGDQMKTERFVLQK